MRMDPLADARTACAPAPRLHDGEQFVENPRFEEVDRSLLNSARWKMLFKGRWKLTGEHITLLEGRTLVLCLRRILRDPANHGMRHVTLGDNLGQVFSVGKGRACDYDMLRVCQQVGALCV